MHTSLLISPHLIHPVLAHFFSALPYPLPPAFFTQVITHVLNAAKSTNPTARSGAVRAVKSLLEPPTGPQPNLPGAPPNAITAGNFDETYAQNVQTARDLILSLLQGSKTSSADHRAALVAILAALPQSNDAVVGAKGKVVEVLNAVLPGVAKDAKEDGWASVGALLKCELPIFLFKVFVLKGLDV
jgi:hypothetical protein